MLLTGANARGTVNVGGMQIEPIHLATETSAKVVAALIAARGNPNMTVKKCHENGPNHKFIFNIDDIRRENSKLKKNRQNRTAVQCLH